MEGGHIIIMWKAYRKRKIINNSKMICELNEIYVSVQKVRLIAN